MTSLNSIKREIVELNKQFKPKRKEHIKIVANWLNPPKIIGEFEIEI